MKDSQIALLFMVVAILGTAIALFRQGALGVKGLVAVAVSTIGLGTFLFITLTPPQ